MKPRPSSRSIQRILEEQVGRWGLTSVPRTETPEIEDEYWPTIVVSRQFGSRGAEAGRIAATRLGFTFWDQEIVEAIADKTGAQQTLLAALDERSRSAVEDFVAHLFFGTDGTAAEYVRQVARVVRTLDKKGASVIVGRGAQYIIDPGQTLRVRVVCPLEQRVEGFAQRQGLTVREAEREIRTVEEDRQAFIRRHYRQDIDDATHYDIVVNTGVLGPALAADVVVSAYGAKFGRLPEQAVASR